MFGEARQGFGESAIAHRCRTASLVDPHAIRAVLVREPISPRGCRVGGHPVHSVPAVVGGGSTRDSPRSIPHNIMHLRRSRRSGHAVEVVVAPGSRLSGIADPVACRVIRSVLVGVCQTIVLAHASEVGCPESRRYVRTKSIAKE